MAEPDSPEPSEPRPRDAQLQAAGVDRAEVMSRLTPGQLTRRVAMAAGVVAVIALAIIELPGLQDVRSRFTHADLGWIVAAAVMEALSIACFVLALQRTFAGRLRPRGAIAVGTTAQGVNAVVPAGGTAGLAFAAVILADGGFPVTFTVGRLIALFLITSVLTNLVLIIVGGGARHSVCSRPMPRSPRRSCPPSSRWRCSSFSRSPSNLLATRMARVRAG